MNEKRTIVILEMLYPKGHKSLDSSIVKILSKNYKIIVLDYKSFFNVQQNNISVIELNKQIIIERHEPFIRCSIFYNLIKIKRTLKDIQYDSILFLSINPFIARFLPLLFKGKNIIVIHHNDIDALRDEHDLTIFKKGIAGIKHIVFGDFIKRAFIRITGCNEKIIFSVPHPITIDMKEEFNPFNRNRTVVGIGLSNDEEFINECIQIDQSGKYDIDYQIVLRSKKYKYNSNSLKVFNGYLNEEEYNDYYLKSAAIIIYYPTAFKYRYSGTLINAMLQNGKVLINEIPAAIEEVGQYKQNLGIIKSAKDLFQLTDDFFVMGVDRKERELYLFNHSDEIVLKKMSEVIEA